MFECYTGENIYTQFGKFGDYVKILNFAEVVSQKEISGEKKYLVKMNNILGEAVPRAKLDMFEKLNSNPKVELVSHRFIRINECSDKEIVEALKDFGFEDYNGYR